MARTVSEMWFGGSVHSLKESKRLVKLLKEGLSQLSGLQQSPHSSSEKEAKIAEEAYEKGEQVVEDIARDLYCALTGKEIRSTKGAN